MPQRCSPPPPPIVFPPLRWTVITIFKNEILAGQTSVMNGLGGYNRIKNLVENSGEGEAQICSNILKFSQNTIFSSLLLTFEECIDG